MAPEIKEGRQYSGQKADIFSTGVVLFIMVRGIFPFKEARREEFFYNLLSQGLYAEYWAKVESQHLSSEFRDLIQRLLAYDPASRPTIEDIRAHPWMKKPSTVTPKSIQQHLIQLVAQYKEQEREAQLK
jgi:serine/threonine protein kinase